MFDSINDKLISFFKHYIPNDKNVVDTLTNLLSLSKESVYRRLRGDISFTLEELIKISNRFGISIDDIVDSGTITNKWATLNPDQLFLFENYIKQYCERLETYINLLQRAQSAQKVKLCVACNIIPYTLLLAYKKLSQLWHYKWSFLMRKSNPIFTFSSMSLPDKLIELEKQFVNEVQKLPKEALIWDKDIFSHIVNDILFFVHQELITQSDLILLKQELLDLVSEIETMTDTGCYKTGESIMIYLSRLNIDTSYYYLEFAGKAYSFQQIFFIDRFSFNNEKICKRQKEWIYLLKRSSILLTQSSNKEKYKFLSDQRRLINAM